MIKEKRKATEEEISEKSRRSDEYTDFDRLRPSIEINKIFKIPDGFVSRLNAIEAFNLS